MHAIPPSPLRVALLGLGTVGREVARGLVGDADRLCRAAAGRRIRLDVVGVRDPARNRGLALPGSVRVTGDLDSVAREDVDVVVELLGGLQPAGDLIAGTLAAGRSVVTANKAVLAARGAELEGRARAAGASLRYEAAVAGGTPVLGPLASDLAANEWSSVRGILNGTTNVILSAMTDQRQNYADALRDAQARGLAEADPAADVEGTDAAHKLVLLARLAFGRWIEIDAIRRALPAAAGTVSPGITGIRAEDIDVASAHDLRLKLVAVAENRDAGIAAAVVPAAVAARSALGATSGATNLVELRGRPVGTVRFSGPGAGGAATSSAVLGDLVTLARGGGSTWAGLPSAAPGPVVDALSDTRRWLAVGEDGSSRLVGPIDATTVAAVAAASQRATVRCYPILEDPA